MAKAVKVALVAAMVLVMGVVGLGVYARWSLRHMQIGFFTPADLDKLIAQVEVARAVVGRNGNCLRTVGQSGIGDRKKEAEMLYVAAMVDFYRMKFGTAASRLTDLNKLPDFEHASALNGRLLEKDCSIYLDQSGSFVVTCGPYKPSNLDVAAFMRNAPFVQKFYTLGGSEILYVPAPKC
jgi:hypothetical protein